MKRFSPRAQKLLAVFAQDEGRKHRSDKLLPEHMLLALLKRSGSVGFAVLQFLKINFITFQLALEQSIPVNTTYISLPEILPSARLKVVLENAAVEAIALGADYIGTEHLVLASFKEEQSIAWHTLKRAGLTYEDVKNAIDAVILRVPSSAYELHVRYNKKNTVQSKHKQNSLLNEYSFDLTQKAEDGKLDPVIGREKEIQRMIQILSRRNKNNPILVGEPGVGKTAIVEGLALKIVSGKVPSGLKNKRLLTLDLASIVAGTKYRGEFEERLKKIMKEIRDDENIIIFIDELHTLIGAGGSEGAMDASNMFKPALSRGELQCIGATTLKEYRKYFERDAALERRFQLVQVLEPSLKESEDILRGIKSSYEEFHGVEYSDDVIETIVRYSHRYITERSLPDKAIDLLDEAGAMKKIKENIPPAFFQDIEEQINDLYTEKKRFVQAQDYEGAAAIRDTIQDLKDQLENQTSEWERDNKKYIVTHEDIGFVLSSVTGIPREQVTMEESNRLILMEKEIHKELIGQNEAVRSVSSAVRRSKAGVSSFKRPIGSFIFLGPTGVGKTLLAKRLAQFLFGSEDALIRVDMSDYMEKHNASRLVGAPPGYVGYQEGGFLTEKVRRNPYSVILLDEIEKAHADVFNILLQILEEGELRDNLGHLVNFRNTIIIMTSNAGVREISLENQLGFSAQNTGVLDYAGIKADALNELRKLMSPELINRIDDIIVFESLTNKEIAKILDIQLQELNSRLFEQGLSLKVQHKAREYLIEKGYNPSFGARPMRRLIQKEIEDVLADKIIAGECAHNDEIIVEYKRRGKKDETMALTLRIKKSPILIGSLISEVKNIDESVSAIQKEPFFS